jgi:catechol 2,3-dioxygenase-like lactoylglutathione lyase family enzyme
MAQPAWFDDHASVAVKQLSLVTIQVRDFYGMVAWYRDVLSLEVGWVEPGEFCTLSPRGGGTSLALATDHPDRITDSPGSGWTPIFAVEDLDAFVAHLRASGVALDAEEEGAEEGYRLVRVRDPEGNPIGLSA